MAITLDRGQSKVTMEYETWTQLKASATTCQDFLCALCVYDLISVYLSVCSK